jgi:hypothetical protein
MDGGQQGWIGAGSAVGRLLGILPGLGGGQPRPAVPPSCTLFDVPVGPVLVTVRRCVGSTERRVLAWTFRRIALAGPSGFPTTCYRW